MKNFKVIANRCGFVDVEASSEEEALEKAKNLHESEFYWGEADDYEVIVE